jgi:hypothetical protein
VPVDDAGTPETAARSDGAGGVGKALGDILRSVGLMAVVVAAILFLTPARALILPGNKDLYPATDFRDPMVQFARVAGVKALVPSPPKGWRATVADERLPSGGPQWIHVGFAVPGSRFAGLDEGTQSADRFIPAVLGKRAVTSTGQVEIGGREWELRTSDRGEQALTTTVGRLTVVITGNATGGELRALAASLAPL